MAPTMRTSRLTRDPYGRWRRTRKTHAFNVPKRTAPALYFQEVDCLQKPITDYVSAPAELCHQCQRAISDFRKRDLFRLSSALGQSRLSLHHASQAGCPICRWVCQKLAVDHAQVVDCSDGDGDIVDNKRIISTWMAHSRNGWYSEQEEPLQVDHSVKNSMQMTRGFRYEEPEGEGDIRDLVTMDIVITEPDVETGAVYQPEEYTGALQSLELVKGWLDHCRRSHSSCHSTRAVGWRPAWLVHWASANNYRDCLMLREAKENGYGDDVRYLTLSHRWDERKPLLLRNSNKAKLSRKLRWHSLKASVQLSLIHI